MLPNESIQILSHSVISANLTVLAMLDHLPVDPHCGAVIATTVLSNLLLYQSLPLVR